MTSADEVGLTLEQALDDIEGLKDGAQADDTKRLIEGLYLLGIMFTEARGVGMPQPDAADAPEPAPAHYISRYAGEYTPEPQQALPVQGMRQTIIVKSDEAGRPTGLVFPDGEYTDFLRNDSGRIAGGTVRTRVGQPIFELKMWRDELGILRKMILSPPAPRPFGLAFSPTERAP